jgi:hypothetical protein
MAGIRILLKVLSGLGALVSAAPAYAGAWTLEAGRGHAIVTATTSGASEVFDGAGRTVAAPRYRKFEFQALFEYGVADWITAIVSPGLQHIDIAAPISANRSGLGNSEFGARYRILDGGNWIFSGQSTVRVPGTFDTGNPAAVGHNRIEFDLRLLFGYSFAFGGWPAFLDLQVAQRFRLGDAPNEMRMDATLGMRPAPQWLVMAQLFNVISQGGSPPLFPSYDYHKFQLTVVYELTRQWSMHAGGFTTYHGRNALREDGLQFGAWYRF